VTPHKSEKAEALAFLLFSGFVLSTVLLGVLALVWLFR